MVRYGNRYTEDQISRLYEIADIKGYSDFDCEKCPVREECKKSAEETTIEQIIYNEMPCCEEILLHYILTGEKPA